LSRKAFHEHTAQTPALAIMRFAAFNGCPLDQPFGVVKRLAGMTS